MTTARVAETGLVRAARTGDEAAFDALVGPLIDLAFKLALVILRDRYEAEDAVQEATIKAWQNLNRLRDESAVRQWFLAIVANHCRTVRRGRWWSLIRLGVTDRSDYETGDQTESRLDLRQKVAQLPPTDRAALFLFFYLDLPLTEAARILQITPQAAKSRVHRAVTKLRLEMLEVQT